MRTFRSVVFAVMAPAMVISGAVAVSAHGERATSQAMDRIEEGKCRVTIDRTQTNGTYDLTRQEYEFMGERGCICYVYTGPKPQSDTVESAIARLQEARECDSAKLAVLPPVSVVAGSTAAGGTALTAVAGGATIAGGAIAGASLVGTTVVGSTVAGVGGLGLGSAALLPLVMAPLASVALDSFGA